uniref:Aminopeptidase n=1 Tax=Haemonchus contortus TaxID=6289 RepID=A0A7I5ED30_HAECO
MTARERKRSLVEFTPFSLAFAMFAVAAAVGLAIGLTYFFTRKAFDPTQKDKDQPGGKEKDNSPSAAELLLPSNIKPLLYDLTIKTYLPGYVNFPPEKNLTFDGRVEISMVVVEPTKSIVLNAKKITVIPAECEVLSGTQKLDIESVKEHERLEKLEFRLKSRLEKDQKILLKITYAGLISNTLGGIYQTTYTDANGNPKIAAVSQNEPIDGRRMVPCMDEPKYKANWTVTVIHPKGTKAASNSIEINGEGDVSGDWITSKFETTPRMSSYLLAVFISEFDFVEGRTKQDVRFRIWSRPEAKGMTKYALESGIKCIEFYEDFFDIKFPLKKQDMIALPDFSAGAMENWGLITYRENSLLYDEKFYGPTNKRRVAVVVAHELAHQWFGDLVTMKWWDDLWLNEGFATFVEYIGADQIGDHYFNMPDFFLIGALERALKADSAASSHPLSFRIDKAVEVEEAFDDISYAKGASIITMLRALIGEDKHKHAVTQYLKKFSYSNAQASDLWEVFDEVVTDIRGPDGKPMKTTAFADQWTTQTNKDAKEPEKYRHPKYGFKWDIPLWYQEGDNKEVKQTWIRREEPLYLHVNDLSKPFVVNADRHGFYRQNYDADGWRKIIKQLRDNHKVFSPRTRNAIISDAFALASVNAIEYETVFELLKYAVNEEEFIPWTEAISGIFAVLKFFGNEPESKPAEAYMMKILEPMYKKSDLGYIAAKYKDDQLFSKINLQKDIIDAYCALGSKDCMKKYKDIFDREVMNKCNDGDEATKCVSVAAPLRSSTYCNGVKAGGTYAFEKVKALYYEETVQLEKDMLLRALGCHRDVTALKGLLLLAVDRNSSFVRLQDIPNAFQAVAANPVGEEFMFNFLIERWGDIIGSIGSEPTYVERVIPPCTSGIRSKQQIDQLRNLHKNGIHAQEYSTFVKEIERAEHKVDWIKKHFKKLASFFKNATS